MSWVRKSNALRHEVLGKGSRNRQEWSPEMNFRHLTAAWRNNWYHGCAVEWSFEAAAVLRPRPPRALSGGGTLPSSRKAIAFWATHAQFALQFLPQAYLPRSAFGPPSLPRAFPASGAAVCTVSRSERARRPRRVGFA